VDDIMKKTFISVLVIASLALSIMTGCSSTKPEAQAKAVEYVNEEANDMVSATQEIINNMPYSDEYQFGTYVITEVYGDEVHGVAIDNKSEERIVLFKSIDNVHVITGDIVSVVFGEYFDEVLDVQVIDNDDLTGYDIQKMPAQIKNAEGDILNLAEDGSYTVY
jgi:hypothetical protein